LFKLIKYFIMSFFILLFFSVSTEAASDKQWSDLVTGADSDGNHLITKVFGYYAADNSQVFIVCDPDTGEELDKAYIGGFEVGQKDIVTGYEYGEDKSSVKKVNPVTVTVMAPNAYSGTEISDYSVDYLNKTGEAIYSTSSVKWPGNSSVCIIPGDDPNYWLIVAEVKNPNNWPVKAKISARVERWRNSSRINVGDAVKIENKEVELAARETKYILMNKGKDPKFNKLYYDSDWSNSGTSYWSEVFYSSNIMENSDPELPEELRANFGYIMFNEYGDGSYEPVDLSSGIPSNAIKTTGPQRGASYVSGPALANYTDPIDTNKVYKVSSKATRIPVLKYSPIFIEYYTFEPTNTEGDIGNLVKEVVTGYLVETSHIYKPYFTMTSSLNDYSIDTVTIGNGKNKEYCWKLTFNRNINIIGKNPDRDVSVTMENIGIIDSNLYDIIGKIYDCFNYEITIMEPNYYNKNVSPAILSFDSITLNPGESRTVYNGNKSTEILINMKGRKKDEDEKSEYKTVIISKDAIDILTKRIKEDFNWSGELAFIGNNKNISFSNSGNNSEQVLSLNMAVAEVETASGKEYEKEVGLIQCDNDWWLGANSYFRDGVCMRTSDKLWNILLSSSKLTGKISYDDNMDFWDVIDYRISSSSSDRWVLYKKFES